MQQGASGGIIAALRPILPDSLRIRDEVLALGGVDLNHLAARFGTPLYVYDDETLRVVARETLAAFRELNARVSFASKACDIIGVMQVFQQEGLDLDVVSAGEMVAGLRAGFDPRQIHLHGNCKSDAELSLACDAGLYAVVIDNLEELDRLQAVSRYRSDPMGVMLRTTLSVEAETHPHLQTSGYSSKFGIRRGSDQEVSALGAIARASSLQLVGVHTHLGSQIADAGIYQRAACELLGFVEELRGQGFPIEEVSIGGGWAVPYRGEDKNLSPRDVARAMSPLFPRRGLRLAVEPGRSLVSRAGIALYRVGSVKSTPTGRIIAVDGGMGDNPRPALYGASYDALRVHKPDEASVGPATIVGRYCESGDILCHSVSLPDIRPGDLLCVPMSGAYHLSMASHYNLVPEPAAVTVVAGEPRLIMRRGTIDELLTRQVGGNTPDPLVGAGGPLIDSQLL